MLLLPDSRIEERRAAVAGPLRPLADSLSADLGLLVSHRTWLPVEKARLTRRGGRCPADGALLEFDPFSPRAHRCPDCGRVYDGEEHYRWWIMGYQLWLAERAVHASVLYRLRGDPWHLSLARDILGRYAGAYASYPNRDNVLGPTRLFFSTYLESIWLLQIAVALDSLGSAVDVELARAVRDRVLAPAAALIESYDEGLSNRQVWNNAAMLAAGALLNDARLVDHALRGPSGLLTHLSDALLADGTWYEGENYHLFAHRGLWYAVTMAESLGESIPADLTKRFDDGFAAPFVSALPDFTFPSRRDSQYAVSLRQWRFAELAELGLARNPGDPRLHYALDRLYADEVPRRNTGRSDTTAEAERNVPASGLTRADLGWRSLLGALPQLPHGSGEAPGSVLLAAQGYAVLRRDAGRMYVALDYGHSGEGHGHPDRLNLLIYDGDRRWLDDVGTGSYVERSLFWYRSTLAHNAPLVDGRSQRRVHGRLVAYDEHGDIGWVEGAVDDAADGVRLERAVVVTPGYVVDELRWRARRDVTVDLPVHVDGALDGVDDWQRATPRGGDDDEDGFPFLEGPERAAPRDFVRLAATTDDACASAWVAADPAVEWWRARAPGPPGRAPRRFYFARARGAAGRITTVWSTRGAVDWVAWEGDRAIVELDGGERHEHYRVGAQWHVEVHRRGARSIVELGPGRAHARATGAERPSGPHRLATPAPATRAPIPIDARGVTFDLGERAYRRSEETWAEAGSPTAHVSLAATPNELTIDIDVHTPHPTFAPRREENELDNEHPDTNSDGVQLHLLPRADTAAADARPLVWLLVPEVGSTDVRVTARTAESRAAALQATWKPTPSGYAIHAAIPRTVLPSVAGQPFALDVLVNETAPGRERRRGQLVLSGAPGEFVYLRGDRQPAYRFLRFVVRDG